MPKRSEVISLMVSTWNGNVVVNDTNNVSASVASLTRNAGETVGSYNITAGTFTLGGSSSGNYSGASFTGSPTLTINQAGRSEERRVGKEPRGADEPSLARKTQAPAG